MTAFSEADALAIRKSVFGSSASTRLSDRVKASFINYYALENGAQAAINEATICLDKVQLWPLNGVDVSIKFEIAAVPPSHEAAQHAVAAIRPISIFPSISSPRDPNLCFVLMPFAESFRNVYEQAISRAVKAAGMVCQRGDDIALPGTIVSQIWASIFRSQVVIADVSGSNGNVLYELGLAHAIGREAILLTQRIEDIPFDLRQQRHILYSLSDLTSLTAKLEQVVRAAKAG